MEAFFSLKLCAHFDFKLCWQLRGNDDVKGNCPTSFKPQVPKNVSKTHLKISIAGVTFAPLRYDTNGYVITYRTTVSMNFQRIHEGKTQNYSTRGMYDFAIEPNAIITDQARFEAIRQGSQKGIDAFIAQIAAQGANS